jgi:hypothetical protein
MTDRYIGQQTKSPLDKFLFRALHHTFATDSWPLITGSRAIVDRSSFARPDGRSPSHRWRRRLLLEEKLADHVRSDLAGALRIKLVPGHEFKIAIGTS